MTPTPTTRWPRLPPDHPYLLPPGYHYPDNLPEAIQGITTLSCHLILLPFRSSSAMSLFVLNFHRNSSYSLTQLISIGSSIQAEATSLRPGCLKFVFTLRISATQPENA